MPPPAQAAVADVLPFCLAVLDVSDLARCMSVCRDVRTACLDFLSRSGLNADLSSCSTHGRIGAALELIGRHASHGVRSLALPGGARPASLAALRECLGPVLVRLELRLLRGLLEAALPADLGAICLRLAHLDLTGSGPVPRQLLASFPDGHPLEALILTGCAFDCGGEAALAALGPLTRLVVLELSRRARPSSQPALEPLSIARGLLAQAKGPRPFPALVALGLGRQERLSAADTAALAESVPSLRGLCLQDAADRSVVRAALALPHLEVLLAGGLPFDLCDGDAVALAAAPAAASLRVLDVSLHGNLSDAALGALAACARLEALVLSRQNRLTAAALLGLALAVPSLAAVTAVRCRQLGERAMEGVADRVAAARLGDTRLCVLLERADALVPWWQSVRALAE